MFRQTNLNDESHINLGRQFGELDDIRPYIAAGRKNRLKYPELFDVGNVEEDGSLVDLSSPKGQHNKVSPDKIITDGLFVARNSPFFPTAGQQSVSCRFELQSTPSRLFVAPSAQSTAGWERRSNGFHRHPHCL